MSWLTKLKEKVQEHTILGLFALITLLSLIIWRAVPAEVWDRVSEVTPKRVLWALLGLLAIVSMLGGAYIRNLRHQLASNLFWRFGVLWDKKQTPHCPACSKPLGRYAAYIIVVSPQWGFMCVQCNKVISMSDDEGNILTFKEAKALLNSKAQSNNSLNPTPR